jgi:hypothetical protein
MGKVTGVLEYERNDRHDQPVVQVRVLYVAR